ncbi:uncharacterized protein LOC141655480 [Silene latifolia]|uniref:uncharacterized protein LOC141655480 n=1 Tax=Silene latifolia TaxID=37657 RepID=UPI003D77DA6A
MQGLLPAIFGGEQAEFIKVNGSIQGFFKGKSGVRQGDPLSPYIFVLSIEVLSRGDLLSIAEVIIVLKKFGDMSGLITNKEKTSIYFGGVHDATQKKILDYSGFTQGNFPFRYLGIPITTSRLTQEGFSVLIKKIQGAIYHWYFKTLTYAGKIFVSLKSILSVRDACIQLASGVQAAKDTIQGCTQNHQFSISKAYEFLRTRAPISRGMTALQSSSVVPSHKIVAALAIQNCLATVDKLQAKGMFITNRCTLCKEAAEDYKHLFFQCKYSKDVWQRILLWTGINRPVHNYWQEMYWIRNIKYSKAWHKHWFLCGLVATVYMLWAERNAQIFRGQERTITQLVGYNTLVEHMNG